VDDELDEIPLSLQTITLVAFRDAIGVDRKTMRKWIREEGLRVIEIGNVKLVRIVDAEAFFEAHTVQSEEPNLRRVQ
jgi:hypothetical protein